MKTTNTVTMSTKDNSIQKCETCSKISQDFNGATWTTCSEKKFTGCPFEITKCNIGGQEKVESCTSYSTIQVLIIYMNRQKLIIKIFDLIFNNKSERTVRFDVFFWAENRNRERFFRP